MADALRHESKLDIAEEILNFIANDPEAEKIKEELMILLELNHADLKQAHTVVKDFINLIKNQEF